MKLRVLLLLAFTNLMAGSLNSQVSVHGPDCAASTILCQYKIVGTPISSSVEVCVTGGLIIDSTTQVACKSFVGKSMITVVLHWTSPNQGTINVKVNGSSTSTKQVNLVSPLNPGLVDSSIKKQIVYRNIIPNEIVCSMPSGGNCITSFTYQWQQSENQINWSDMAGEQEENLKIKQPLSKSMFYRRRTKENKSGSFGVSDVASVFVILREGESAQ